MNSPGLGDGLSASSRREREKILNRFEDAWQTGAPPRLENFCPARGPAGPAGSEAARLLLLRDLLKIDLEYRWQRAGRGQGSDVPRLEQYGERYPEIFAGPELLRELIGEEYRVRQRWGDRPNRAEYLARFGSRVRALSALLQELDTELAAEVVREGRPPDPAAPVSGGRPLVSPALTTVQSLLDALREHQLLAPGQMPALAELQRRCTDARALARELIERGWLTAYQVNQLLQGRGADLVVESYLLLERLGEGGMGQVFKARHLDMQRLVALKLIRKELLVDGEAVGRFRREVQVLSQLTHPHVVQAFDAGLTGPTPFLAMEYVEGVALGRLVKERGPLPAAQACDFVRQAALGLQHIHERGLVHRDIKPANLIVANGQGTQGLVKIVDLGLARLLNPVQRAGAADQTASGAIMMGTLDYMAPEQALDFSKADIRADIYSLGCTLYYLLTGQPPFPEGTMAQKLLLHQMKEPAPLETLRRDLPAGLSSVLLRMMAKQPVDRYQTPAQVAQALDGFTAGGRAVLPVPVTARPALMTPVAVRQALVPAPGAVIVVNARPARRRPLRQLGDWLQRRPPQQRRRLFLAAGVAACLVLALGLWSIVRSSRGPEVVFLSDLQPVEVKGGVFGNNGFLNLQSGFRAVVDGRVSAKGLIIRPPDEGSTQVTYRLGKRYRQFKTAVALDDKNQGTTDTVRFSVIGDGKVLWESRPVKRARDVQECDIPVRDVELLELVVSNQGGHGWLVVWFDPKLTR